MTDVLVSLPDTTVLEFFRDFVFLYKRYPIMMLKTMAKIEITRKRRATIIHAVCDPSDFELWSARLMPRVWFTEIVVATGCNIEMLQGTVDVEIAITVTI